MLGLLGPFIVPFLLVHFGYWDENKDSSGLGFLKRSLDPRTLKVKWYALVIFLVMILAFGPVLLHLIGSQEDQLIDIGPVLFLMIGFIAGAVEEPGWRGYAQEGLQRQMPILSASLVVGIFWALWHLPLFLIAGTYQSGLGLGTISFWAFMFGLVLESPIYAWIYNKTGGIVFSAVLLHGLGNLVRELVPSVDSYLEIGVVAIIAIVLTLASWKWLMGKEKVEGRKGANAK